MLLTIGHLPRSEASGQVIRYGIRVGAGVANFNYQPDVTDTFRIYSTNLSFYEKGGGFKPSFSVGGVVERPFTDNFMISLGVQFSVMTAASSGKALNYQFPIQDYSIKVFSLQIPVTAHCQFRKTTIGAGGFVGFAFAGSSNLVFDTTKSLYHPVYLPLPNGKHSIKFADKTDSNLRRFNAGLRLEVGYPIRMVKLSIAYEQGLVNVLPHHYEEFQLKQNRKGTLRTQSVLVSITYYWIKK